jgi:cbb3-type cytochrome oxidase subunit 1
VENIMQGAARLFFILSLIYAVSGMLLGLHMAISQDHGQMPTHAHTMVAGWVMSALFAFFYHLFPDIGRSRLAFVHFWVQAISGVILVVSLYFLLGGRSEIEPVTASASVGFLAGMLIFVIAALPVLRRA